MLLGFTQVAELKESDSRWELKSNIQVLSHSEDSRWELKSNIQVLLGYCENIQLMVSHLAFTSITSGWLQLWLWVDNPLQCCKGLDQPGHIYELWNTLTLSTQKNVSIRLWSSECRFLGLFPLCDDQLWRIFCGGGQLSSDMYIVCFLDPVYFLLSHRSRRLGR